MHCCCCDVVALIVSARCWDWRCCPFGCRCTWPQGGGWQSWASWEGRRGGQGGPSRLPPLPLCCDCAGCWCAHSGGACCACGHSRRVWRQQPRVARRSGWAVWRGSDESGLCEGVHTGRVLCALQHVPNQLCGPASLSRCRTVSACGTAHAASQYASVAHGHCGCTAVGRMQQRACSAL